MNGREFIRRARRYAKSNGLAFALATGRDKGSHVRLTIGSRITTVQHGEIAPNTLADMLRQLNIDRREF